MYKENVENSAKYEGIKITAGFLPEVGVPTHHEGKGGAFTRLPLVHQILPVLPIPSCRLLRSLVSPLVLGLAVGATVATALGGRLPGILTVVLSKSISLPCTFCM